MLTNAHQMNFLRNTPMNEDKDLHFVSHLHHIYSLNGLLHLLLVLQNLLGILQIHTCVNCLDKIISQTLQLI